MREAGVDPETVAMLGEMCNNETSWLILNGRKSRPFRLQKGVRQGGISSPTCFNFIPEMLSRELHMKPDWGIVIPGYAHRINHLLYADDLILFGTSNEHLRVLVLAVTRWARKYKLSINSKKTEVIALNTNQTPRIYINNTKIAHSNPTYLGYTLDSKMKGEEHLKMRQRKGKQKLLHTLASLHRLPRLKINVKANIV